MEKSFLFQQTTCYINGEEKKGTVIAIAEFVDRRRVCFLVENETSGQWFQESSLFVNEPQTKTSRNQPQKDIVTNKVNFQVKNETNKEVTLESSFVINAPLTKTLNNQEENIIVPTKEQVKALIKENGSDIVSLNEAITRKIITDWETIAKWAQDTHSSITKAIQTIVSPIPEPNKEQVIEAIKETNDKNWYDKRERYIQDFISNYLHEQGVENSIETLMDNGQYRADIVASSISSVIEVKRIIDERTLWLAVEQVSAYAHRLGMRYSIVVGLPPQDLNKYKLVKQEAARLEKWNLKIIFLDPSSETLGLEKHFQELPPDSLVTNLLVLVRQLREVIMAYIEAVSKATVELLRNAKQQPVLRPS